MESNELNLNYKECVKSYNKFGETIYVNICNGAEKSVPWGVEAWFGVSLVAILLLVIFVIFLLGISDY